MESSKKAKTKHTDAEVAKMFDVDDPIKPDDQLNLTPDELEEIHGNILYIKEPPKPQAQVIYNFRKKEFEKPKIKKKWVTLIDMKTGILHRESSQANIQIENELCRVPETFAADSDGVGIEEEEEGDKADFDIFPVDDNVQTAEEVGEEFMDEENEMDEIFEMDENEEQSLERRGSIASKDSNDSSRDMSKEKSSETLISLPIKKHCSVIKLKNEFNFFNRYTSTRDTTQKDNTTQTIVIKIKEFETDVSLPKIYDAYDKDFAKKEEEKEKELRGKMAALSKKVVSKTSDTNFVAPNQIEENIFKTLIVMEKVLVNGTSTIPQDFRSYEDGSDKFRNRGEGTLLPMWTMVYENAKTLFVTDISWSPDYYDMFAVSLGLPKGYLPLNDNPDVGYVCLWSLSNSSYPEYAYRTDSGAMCVSFNRERGYVLAVGLQDGTLAVYNVSLPVNKPQYVTNAVETKHMGSVRQVIWCKDTPSGEMNFFSVSEDGTVCQWILLSSEMFKIVKMRLILDMYSTIIGGIKHTYYAMGTTIAFNPADDEIYMVGTVEGYVYKCNTKWSRYVHRFKAHLLPVSRIVYNQFNPNIYLTCSEDFTVKLWEDNAETPLVVFDVKTAMADVCWSPFSSTVFAAISTTDCRAIFYDIDVSLKEPVCDQPIFPPETHRLLKMAFDRRVPMVVIGCSKCTTISFKLSPNLRETLKPSKKGVQESSEQLEMEKLRLVIESIHKLQQKTDSLS